MACTNQARILQKQVENTGLLVKFNIVRGYSWLGYSCKLSFALCQLRKKKSLENIVFSRLFVLVEISGIEPLTS